MINYQQAKNILKKAKIKIQDENTLIKNSFNRVVAKDIISPSNHPLGNNAALSISYATDDNDPSDNDLLVDTETKHTWVTLTVTP